MGHAIVAHFLENTDPVHKISVISRGQALGYTISLPTEDKFLTTRAELSDTMAMTLGGRAAEEIVFGEVTTGAVERPREGHRHRQADGHALRHVREARPARVRPRPRPALPRPRVLLRARLLRRDRARDRRRDPPHRRGGPPGRARHPRRAPREARHASRRSCSSARRSSASSSWSCWPASRRRRSSAATSEIVPVPPRRRRPRRPSGEPERGPAPLPRPGLAGGTAEMRSVLRLELLVAVGRRRPRDRGPARTLRVLVRRLRSSGTVRVRADGSALSGVVTDVLWGRWSMPSAASA